MKPQSMLNPKLKGFPHHQPNLLPEDMERVMTQKKNITISDLNPELRVSLKLRLYLKLRVIPKLRVNLKGLRPWFPKLRVYLKITPKISLKLNQSLNLKLKLKMGRRPCYAMTSTLELSMNENNVKQNLEIK